ncbi:MAG: phosphatase PAP2 family protein, partial [Synechococcus sp.]|nr:phosphatase PAP2 family protein [Synechococcus sp.]
MSVIEFLQGFFGERFLGFFLAITQLGSEKAYLLLLGLYYWLVDPRQGRLVTLILVASVMSNIFLKQAFALPRPYVLNPAVMTPEALHTAGSFSFPSGHAQGITTFWGAIAFLQQKRWLWIFEILIIVLVSLSRLYLGVHFPVDVAAGVILGIGWIALGLWLNRFQDRLPKQLGQRLGVWLLGGLMVIAFPKYGDILGIFCGFLPIPTSQWQPPPKIGSKIGLGLSSLV